MNEVQRAPSGIPPGLLAEGIGQLPGNLGRKRRLLVDAVMVANVERELLFRDDAVAIAVHVAETRAEVVVAGDLGALDDAGYLRITGRRKDIIIRKGENISARELEDLIAAHPAIAEVAVVGVPDAVAGEIACAVVRVRAGTRAPSLGELAAALTAQGLSRRKLPERLEVVEEFPRTASGKILKRTLRDGLARP